MHVFVNFFAFLVSTLLLKILWRVFASLKRQIARLSFGACRRHARSWRLPVRVGRAEVPIATLHVSVGDRTPILPAPLPSGRPRPRARHFRSGVRVEMGALAAQLGISQPTLYRWSARGSTCFDTVLERITDETVAVALTAAKGDGDERVLDFIRRFADASGTFEAGHKFIAREPELALRLILSERRGVHRSAASSLRDHRCRPALPNWPTRSTSGSTSWSRPAPPCSGRRSLPGTIHGSRER